MYCTFCDRPLLFGIFENHDCKEGGAIRSELLAPLATFDSLLQSSIKLSQQVASGKYSFVKENGKKMLEESSESLKRAYHLLD